MNIQTVMVRREVQAQKRIEADAWRKSLAERHIFCVNIISSPGAGKTSLLQATARHWKKHFKIAVLVGDIATDRDAQRLSPFTQVKQLTTGGACHLELPLVQSGSEHLDLNDLQFLFIENIGNLVCPASHDLGEHLRVVVLSVTEGDDKPAKYPKAFRTSQLCLINKVDLLPHVPFSLDAVAVDARRINANIPVIATSATTNHGIAEWCEFLITERQKLFGTPER